MTDLQNRIEYHFRDLKLLQTALTHSSYANEHQQEHSECYERLEFLGDSILGLTAAEYLYRWQPSLPEGKMTRIRAELVCEESLHRVATDLGLGQWMRLGKGEERSSGRERPSILADMVEAVIAAVYLDGGMEPAVRLIHEKVLSHAGDTIQNRNRDNKTELQELVQRRPGQNLFYRLAGESGPDHDKRFIVEVLLNDEPVGTGEGSSKKRAEQAAAHSAMLALFPNETAR